MPERKLKNWLDSYLDYTSYQESTEKMHFWVGLSVLSAAVKRQLWMRRVRYKIYPNLYIILVGDSGATRKSVAMNIGMKLLRSAIDDIYYITGSMTSEGLVKHMNRSKIILRGDSTGKPTIVTDSHVMVHADELATTFSYDRSRAAKFTMLLTEIYGSDEEYMHTLASENQIVLRNLYPVFLAGTDPRNLKVLPEDAVAGMIGRTIFVTEKKLKRLIAWSSDEDDVLADALGSKLKEDLQIISSLHGQVTVTQKANDLFKSWYTDGKREAHDDPYTSAFYARCHDTALKLAMLFSISCNDSLIIDYKHVAKGIEYVEKQVQEFSNVREWAATSTYSQTRARFIDMLRRQGGAGTRRQMMKMLSISLEEITGIETSLEAEHTVTIKMIKPNIVYKLSKEELLK